jgi:PA domain/Secretion system C-terminal sorting domain
MRTVLYKPLIFLLALFTFSIALKGQDPINIRVTSPSGVDWDIDAIKTANDHGPQIMTNLSGELVKAFDGVTAPTDNDTWTEVGAYCCLPIVNGGDIAGKIAYIGRGSCPFSVKILHAQNAGAIGVIIANRAPIGLLTGTHNPGLIIMAPTAPQSDSITIPAVFISFEDRLELEQMMDAGPVNITFEAEPLYDPTNALAYATPLDMVRPLDMKVVAYNRDGDTLQNVVFTIDITDPLGDVSTFTESVDTLLPGKDLILGTVHDPLIEFEGEYIPSEVGTYTVTYSATTAGGNHPLDNKTLTTQFEVTDHMFAVDNGTVEDVNGMQLSKPSYSGVNGVYGVGSYFYPGANGNVTHCAFAVANPGALNVGLGFTINATLYQVPSTNGVPMDDAAGIEVMNTTYELSGAEVPNELIYVEFPGAASLEADSVYLLMIESDGFQFSEEVPAYSTAGGFVTPNKATAYKWGDVYESSGFEYWNSGSADYPHGGRHPMVRLYTEGFTPPVGVDLLPEDQLTIAPTVSSTIVYVTFDLAQPSSEVYMIITAVNGQTMYAETHNNILKQTINLDVSSYAAGAYFVTVKTDKGARTKKFVVVR